MRSNNDCPDDRGNQAELCKERYSRQQVDASKPEVCDKHGVSAREVKTNRNRIRGRGGIGLVFSAVS